MKIAIATDDFTTITGHVGRCNGFLIYDVENGVIKDIEQRENEFTHHKVSHEHSHNEHGHSHSKLVEGLSDCSHLICKSAGWRLQEDFERAEKELIFTNEEIAEEAAIKFSKNELIINSNGACHSH